MITVLTLYDPIVKPQPECSTLYMLKRPVGSCCLAWLLTIANKDSFDSTEAGLFTSTKANKAEVCAALFAKTSKNNRHQQLWTHTWLTVCHVHFADMLATFTVNLIASVSYAKVPSCAVAISHKPHFLCFDYIFCPVLLFQTLCHLKQAQWEKRHWCWGVCWWLCFNCVKAWVCQPKFLT